MQWMLRCGDVLSEGNEVTRAETSVLCQRPEPQCTATTPKPHIIRLGIVIENKKMGQPISKLQDMYSVHVPPYQLSLTVRNAARNRQAERQRRMHHLSQHQISFGTRRGIQANFNWQLEKTLR